MDDAEWCVCAVCSVRVRLRVVHTVRLQTPAWHTESVVLTARVVHTESVVLTVRVVHTASREEHTVRLQTPPHR